MFRTILATVALVGGEIANRNEGGSIAGRPAESRPSATKKAGRPDAGLIGFVGNSAFDDARLARVIAGQAGVVRGLIPDPGRLGERKALIKFYQQNGYFDICVTPLIKPGPLPGWETVTFVISEGDHFK